MFALTGMVSLSGVLGGANVGLIAVAVLCVNNLRDIESDRAHGKHTWMTALGRHNGTVFTIVLLAAAVLLAVAYARLQSSCTIPVIAMLTVTGVTCAAAAIAIIGKHYGKALLLCTLASLALAAVFVVTAAFA